MARGHPDYIKSVGYTPEGLFLEEYAIPPIWFQDDFESPVNKWWCGLGACAIVNSAVVGARTFYPYNGSGMFVIESAVGGEGRAQRTIGTFPLTTHIGVSNNFCLCDEDLYEDAVPSLVLIDLDFYTGTYRFNMVITYNPRDYNWYYGDGAVGPYVFMFNLRIQEFYWHYVKLIFDPINHQFQSFQIDHYIHDLKGINYYHILNATPAGCNLGIRCFGDVAKSAVVLIDDYKLTYGES